MPQPPKSQKDLEPLREHFGADWSSSEAPAEGDEKSLRRVLVEQGALPWEEVVRLGVQVASQLDSFHQRGVCPHGAVCPESIVQLATGSSYVLGLPLVGPPLPYRAPETHKARGRNADARSDVFSLGVVLFEALAGNRVYPFRVTETRGEVGGSPEVSYLPDNELASLAPAVPPELRRIIERATRLAPENRFDSAIALADALRSVGDHAAAALSARPPARRAGEKGKSRRIAAAVAISGLALIVAASTTVILRSRSSQSALVVQRARDTALEVSAPTLAPDLWKTAESASASLQPNEKSELYRRAAEAAWQRRMEQVANAAQRAIAFDATGEAAFARASDAKARAEHLWQSGRVTDAMKSLAEAEEFYLAAIHNRRERWIEAIRAQLRPDVERSGRELHGEDALKIRAAANEIEALLEKNEPTVHDLRLAEAKVADLRQDITRALERAGELAAARQRGSEAIQRATLAMRSAERAVQAFATSEGTFARGKEFLDAAQQALSNDPSQAVTLAEAALQRFRQVEAAAERELAQLRQAAARARSEARNLEVENDAPDAYSAAEDVWQQAESRERDWLQRKNAYRTAKAEFERATAEAKEARERAAQSSARKVPTRVEQLEPPEAARVLVPPAANRQSPPPPVAAVAPAPTLAPLPARPPARGSVESAPQGPMPAELANAIQVWLRDTCEGLNRSAARGSGTRVRCEDLVVHDRRDRAQVRITYSVAYGTVVPEGIRWDTPATRAATLDCSRGSCRCVAGEGC